ncbi:uncharacterized protein LOC135200970 [Macrobrachium nipponense]|uniref:uncharacterized protein LOC135200970 n=1 Tax=Macrobrachium nipponense TaxID=159736 RepID=UPI0030C8809C
MLSSPTWSGSIQQDLIEKLWVAILTWDADDAASVQKSRDDEAKKKAGKRDDDDLSDESTSSSSDDSDDHDSDLGDDFSDLGAVGDSSRLPQVNRFDLFSVAKLKQSQQKNGGSTELQDVNGNLKDEEKESDDKTDKIANEKQKEIESSIAGEATEGQPSNVSPKVSPQAPGARPKLIQSKSHHSIGTESQRPRPNTLSFTKPQNTGKKLFHSSSFSFPSRYPTGAKSRGGPDKESPVSHFAKPGNCRDRKSPLGVPKQSPSGLPASPQRPQRVFPSQDRANLLDVVPRRRLMSDPKSSHGTSGASRATAVWHRKAVTPDASRPYPPLHRLESIKREAKNDEASLQQRRSLRGNLRRWNTSTSTTTTGSTTRKDVRPSSVFMSPSLGDEARGTANCKKSPQKTGEKQEKQKILSSPDVSTANRRKGNAAQPCKPNGATNSITTFSSQRANITNIKSPNKETQRLADTPSLSQRKLTAKKVNAKGQEPTKLSQNAEPLREVRGRRGETEVDIPDGNSREEEEATNKAGGADPDLHERTIYGNEAEVTRLENCLKEAILGVLQGLPEGWILVPEHTAELFSSLSSVVDSFPRPNHARSRVLEAIVDAHAKRPCDKGEIAALNNAHLLLYVGLKLCSQFWGRSPTGAGRESMLKPPAEGGGLQLSSETKEPRKGPAAGCLGNEDEGKESRNEDEGKESRNEDESKESRNEDEAEDPRNEDGSKESGNENASGKGAPSCGREENGNSDVKLELEQKGIALKILGEILKCEGSFDRLMMCLLLGSRAPGRGSGWYCETEDENEKVEDLRFVLDHLKFVEGCRVSEVVNTPLWSCGSSPVVLAALAESPRLVLALLQYGAGGGPANLYLYSRCYTNGVYLAIAYLVRKLESQFREATTEEEGNGPGADGEEAGEQAAPPEAGRHLDDDEEGRLLQGDNGDVPEREVPQREKGSSGNRDLLKLAGPTPTALCLRYLLRAVPRVPIKFLRDQLSGCFKDSWQDVAHLLPHPCCLQPPSLLHLSRAACRQHFRNQDLLPQVIDDLNVPETLREYLNLLRD